MVKVLKSHQNSRKTLRFSENFLVNIFMNSKIFKNNLNQLYIFIEIYRCFLSKQRLKMNRNRFKFFKFFKYICSEENGLGRYCFHFETSMLHFYSSNLVEENSFFLKIQMVLSIQCIYILSDSLAKFAVNQLNSKNTQCLEKRFLTKKRLKNQFDKKSQFMKICDEVMVIKVIKK